MNSPSAYLTAKGSRLGELEAMSKLDWTEGSVGQWYRQQPGLQLGTLSKPKKKNIINELMSKFDEKHSEPVFAANLESEGAAKIITQRMSAKVGAVEKERSAAKGTAEAEPAFEVDDVVGALWLYQTFMKDEVAACGEDRSMNNIVILKKVLINELTLALSSLALDAVNGHGINLDKIYVTSTTDKADNTCIEDIFQNTNSTDVTRFLHVGTSGLRQRCSQFESPVFDPSRIFSRHGILPGWVGRTSATAALTCASDGMSSPLGRARSK